MSASVPPRDRALGEWRRHLHLLGLLENLVNLVRALLRRRIELRKTHHSILSAVAALAFLASAATRLSRRRPLPQAHSLTFLASALPSSFSSSDLISF